MRSVLYTMYKPTGIQIWESNQIVHHGVISQDCLPKSSSFLLLISPFDAPVYNSILTNIFREIRKTSVAWVRVSNPCQFISVFGTFLGRFRSFFTSLFRIKEASHNMYPCGSGSTSLVNMDLDPTFLFDESGFWHWLQILNFFKQNKEFNFLTLQFFGKVKSWPKKVCEWRLSH